MPHRCIERPSRVSLCVLIMPNGEFDRSPAGRAALSLRMLNCKPELLPKESPSCIRPYTLSAEPPDSASSPGSKLTLIASLLGRRLSATMLPSPSSIQQRSSSPKELRGTRVKEGPNRKEKSAALVEVAAERGSSPPRSLSSGAGAPSSNALWPAGRLEATLAAPVDATTASPAPLSLRKSRRLRTFPMMGILPSLSVAVLRIGLLSRVVCAPPL
jgi:hypothetical protein